MRNKFLVLLFLPLVSVAQLSLDSAVAIALRQNLDIAIQGRNLEASEARYDLGNAGFLPVLTVGGSYNYSQGDFSQQLANSNDLITREDAVSENLQGDITMSYVLFDGLGRLNNYRKLGYQRDLSEVQLRFAIENVLLQVYASYLELARLQEQRSIAEANLAISQRRLERAQIALEVGSDNRLSLLNAQVDLSTDSATYLDTQAALAKSKRQLNQLLNLPADADYAIDTTLTINPNLQYTQLLNRAMENNATLIQSQYQRNLIQQDVRIAWSAFAPQISAQGGYQYSRQENEGSFLQFTENQGWQGGISARWTLFNGNRNKTQIELAKIQLEQSKLEVDKSKLQLETDLANAYIDYQNNLKLYAMERRNLDLAELNFSRSQEAFGLGQINSTQLREAQLNLAKARARLQNRKYSSKIAEVELLRLAGLLLQQIK